MPWWVWMLIALALLATELTMPSGLYLLFFGVSALIVGTLVGMGLIVSVWMQWLLFTIFAVLALAALRGPLKARLHTGPKDIRVDPLVNEIAVVTEIVEVGGAGKVDFRGSPWTAKNASNVALTAGQRCRVDRVEGLTVWIRPE